MATFGVAAAGILLLAAAGSRSSNVGLANTGAAIATGAIAYDGTTQVSKAIKAAEAATRSVENHIYQPFSIPGKMFQRRWVTLDFSDGGEGSPVAQLSFRTKYLRSLRQICEDINDVRKKSTPTRPKAKDDGITKLFKKLFTLISYAEASLTVDTPEIESCTDMTNSEVHKLLTTDKNHSVYNQLIQEQMDSLKKEIADKIKNKNSQCEVDFIDVPNLFVGGGVFEEKPGKFELPEGRAIQSARIKDRIY